MKLLFTRHGEVESNIRDLFNGNVDDNLLDSGKVQANKLGEFMSKKGYELKEVISSEKKRAIQTAEIISKHMNYESRIVIDSRINELDFGIFDGKSFEFVKENYSDIYQARKNDKFNFRIPEGESYQDLSNRLEFFLYDLLDKFRNGEVIFLVTHATTIKMLIHLLTNKTLEQVEENHYSNTCFFEYDISKNGEKIDAKEVVFDSLEHLE